MSATNHTNGPESGWQKIEPQYGVVRDAPSPTEAAWKAALAALGDNPALCLAEDPSSIVHALKAAYAVQFGSPPNPGDVDSLAQLFWRWHSESGAPLEVRSYMRQLAEWSVANWSLYGGARTSLAGSPLNEADSGIEALYVALGQIKGINNECEQHKIAPWQLQCETCRLFVARELAFQGVRALPPQTGNPAPDLDALRWVLNYARGFEWRPDGAGGPNKCFTCGAYSTQGHTAECATFKSFSAATAALRGNL